MNIGLYIGILVGNIVIWGLLGQGLLYGLAVGLTACGILAIWEKVTN